MLQLQNVTRRFGPLEAAKDVTLDIESGEFFTLLGPSGCGKTTLLRMIAGFDLPDAGRILLDGIDLAGTPAERRPIHTVFQSYALFPHLSVADNVAFPLRMAGKTSAEVRRRTGEMLDVVHLADKADSFPDELSGGQKQRVALARGLVNKPRLLLLDEPLGALDHKLREAMQIELINLQREVGVTFVFVTHSQPEALALSHRIALMRDGRVEQVDTPEGLYSAPRNRFVADFIGDINLFPATVTAIDADSLCLDVTGLGAVKVHPPDGVSLGQRGAFAIRPERVRIVLHGEHAAETNQRMGRVRDALYVGDVTTYKVELDNGTLLQALLPNVMLGRAKCFAQGDAVAVAWPAQAGMFLGDESTGRPA